MHYIQRFFHSQLNQFIIHHFLKMQFNFSKDRSYGNHCQLGMCGQKHKEDSELITYNGFDFCCKCVKAVKLAKEYLIHPPEYPCDEDACACKNLDKITQEINEIFHEENEEHQSFLNLLNKNDQSYLCRPFWAE